MRNEGVAELAKHLGCSKAYASMVLNGKKKPSRRMAQRLDELTELTKVNQELTKRLANPVVVSTSASKYNPNTGTAEWCSGSTGEFGSLSPGSIPGSAANSSAGTTAPPPNQRPSPHPHTKPTRSKQRHQPTLPKEEERDSHRPRRLRRCRGDATRLIV